MPGETGESIIAEDLPKLLGCLSNIKEISNGLNEHAQLLLNSVKDGKLETSNGISLLDVKYNYMLQYIIDILSCVDCKVNGNSIDGNSSIDSIVECRTTLEKTRPLEQKLRYQIDKILEGTAGSHLHKDDPLQFKPDLDNFESGSEPDETEESAKNESDKYVPPHIASMKYDEEEGEAKNNKSIEKSKQRALHSSLIAELVQESTDAPMEVSHHSQTKTKVLKHQEERNKFEEEYMTRVSMSKKERSAEKRGFRQSELDTISKFGNIGVLDDVYEEEAKKSRGKPKARRKFKNKKRKFK